MSLPILYRFYEDTSSDGVNICIQKFYAIRETKCFYFVVDGFEKSCLEVDKNYDCKARKVGKNAARSYCHTSKEAALTSFVIRKRAQVKHAKLAIATSEQISNFFSDSNGSIDPEKVKEMSKRDKGRGIFCGKPDYYNQLTWCDY